ncbi:hypothetical protein BY458DRAFT_510483 [Sporodiniella umbellata]|nr:hypothetical protein BY458DRAFT_510483 [Sporodiniella umbellata]
MNYCLPKKNAIYLEEDEQDESTSSLWCACFPKGNRVEIAEENDLQDTISPYHDINDFLSPPQEWWGRESFVQTEYSPLKSSSILETDDADAESLSEHRITALVEDRPLAALKLPTHRVLPGSVFVDSPTELVDIKRPFPTEVPIIGQDFPTMGLIKTPHPPQTPLALPEPSSQRPSITDKFSGFSEMMASLKKNIAIDASDEDDDFDDDDNSSNASSLEFSGSPV